MHRVRTTNRNLTRYFNPSLANAHSTICLAEQLSKFPFVPSELGSLVYCRTEHTGQEEHLAYISR